MNAVGDCPQSAPSPATGEGWGGVCTHPANDHAGDPARRHGDALDPALSLPWRGGNANDDTRRKIAEGQNHSAIAPNISAQKVRAQIAFLPGGRLHLNDGPIDLIIGAFRTPSAVKQAYAAAARRFATILDELCDELPLLRSEMLPSSALPHGATARRMDAAVRPFADDCFITRMAAVAGAVSDEILAAMLAAAELDRAYVNNGGDIALHLAAGQSFAIGMVDRPDRPCLFGKAHISAGDGIGGIATSGRHGRSFSLGIADAVTILATNAAAADVAATIVGNAVDLPRHPNVTRMPANGFDPQSDLGSRLVTRGVGALSRTEIAEALASGETLAQHLLSVDRIAAAALHLRGETNMVGGVF